MLYSFLKRSRGEARWVEGEAGSGACILHILKSYIEYIERYYCYVIVIIVRGPSCLNLSALFILRDAVLSVGLLYSVCRQLLRDILHVHLV